MKYPTDKGPLLLQLEKKTHRERKHFKYTLRIGPIGYSMHIARILAVY